MTGRTGQAFPKKGDVKWQKVHSWEAGVIVELEGQCWRGLGHHAPNPMAAQLREAPARISQPKASCPGRLLHSQGWILSVHCSHHHLPPYNPRYS